MTFNKTEILSQRNRRIFFRCFQMRFRTIPFKQSVRLPVAKKLIPKTSGPTSTKNCKNFKKTCREPERLPFWPKAKSRKLRKYYWINQNSLRKSRKGGKVIKRRRRKRKSTQRQRYQN